jgi:hypothetical protein
MVDAISTTALNIKNSEVHTLAAELAHLRNVSVTQAVLDAVRNEMAKKKAHRRRKDLAQELIAIG